MLRTALAVCVPIAGFATGRGLRPSPVKPESAVAASKAAVSPPRGGNLPSLLCEISGGNLARARARIGSLRDGPSNPEELLELDKLLAAIAKRDGATFDAIVATFPGNLRDDLVERCAKGLENEPEVFLRLLAESEEFSRVALAREMTVLPVRAAPGLFLDLLEQGKFAWPSKTLESVAYAVQQDPASALRLLELCRAGRVTLTNGCMLGYTRFLDDKGLAKLRSAPGEGLLADLIEQEAKARALFANFDPTGKSWDGIGPARFDQGMEEMISRSGVPSIDWSSVPPDFRDSLPADMARIAAYAQGDAGARVLLDSIKKAELPEASRNHMLESAASALFGQGGNIRLAIDFAHAISNDADGHNAGEDLLIKWMAFDPASAQDFTTKIGPSPYRDRILERVREISP
ncbi:hypothetical protein [Haloferula sp. BvORR071]|uniref:hypothetical protein n=1 Tax=Haloferula sp. BvORR071 TaxID=1396141 RepID=UPI002240FAC2|nr:hypothetical protein [Haloferula sp. BvORR071]